MKVLLLFFVTVLSYRLDRLFGENWEGLTDWLSNVKHNPILVKKTHAKLSFHILIIFICLLILTQLSFSFVLSALPIAFLSFIYAIPILPGGMRLREVSVLKIFLIAFVWAYVSVFFVTDLNSKMAILIFTERFFFIYAITIPFDLRDSVADKKYNLKTMPHVLGIKGAQISAVVALLINVLIAHSNPVSNFYAVFITSCLAFLLILMWSEDKKWYYYLFCLDGLIVLQALLILFLN